MDWLFIFIILFLLGLWGFTFWKLTLKDEENFQLKASLSTTRAENFALWRKLNFARDRNEQFERRAKITTKKIKPPKV